MKYSFTLIPRAAPWLIAVFTAFALPTFASDYYYYKGRPIFLDRDPALVGVEFDPAVPNKDIMSLRSTPHGIEIEKVLVAMPRRRRYICRLKETPAPAASVDAAKLLAADPRVRGTYPVFRNPKNGLLVFVFDEFIVRLRPEIDRQVFRRFLQDRGVEIVERDRYESDIYLLRIKAGAGSALDVANEFARSGLFLWSQPNFGRQVRKASVNDPFFPNQWHLDNTGQTGGTPDADIDAPEAWTITTGSPDIVIAILDDGVDLAHEDLAAHIFVNPGESGDGRENNGIDDDGNGYIDDVNGWDFFDHDNDPDHAIRIGQAEGHGTAVAGLAAAVGDNNLGVAGVAYNCRILPVKVFRGDSFTGDFDAADAIRYASTLADVLNQSWGGGLPSDALDAAIAFAVETGRGGLGCPVFSAAGNDAAGLVSYPGRNIWTVAVGASDNDDKRSNFSNYGPQLTFLAPNGNFTTDQTGVGAGFDAGDASGNYTGVFGGTSAATPIAAGTAALLLSLDPNLTALQVQHFMQATTDKVDPASANYDATGFSLQYGYGRINANAALLALQQGSAPDDQFEENDTSATAPLLEEGLYSALACLDDDWYALQVGDFQDIVARISFLHQAGDLQMELYGPDGVLAVRSAGTTNSEQIDKSVGEDAGRWLLHVFGNAGATNYYHLKVDLRPPDDRFEPNDSLDAAAPIDPGDYDDLHGFDADFYRIRVPSGQKLTALITFPNELGDLDLYLLDTAGNVLEQSTSVEDVEGFAHVNQGPDTDFIIFVDNYADSENTYRMRITISSGEDDRFEENDSEQQASPLEPGTYGGLQWKDEDWYCIEVGPDQMIDAEIRFAHAIGDLDLELYDEASQPVDESLGFANSERVFFLNTVPSTVSAHLRVFSFENVQTDYTLLIDRRDLIDDSFEENDTFDTKAPIVTDTYGNLVACDDDFYGIDAAAGQTIAALLVPREGRGLLRLNSWTPTGIEMDSIDAGQPSVLVVRNLPTSGTYGLQVNLPEARNANVYALSTFVYTPVSSPPPGDDRFEPNNRRVLESPLLSSGVYSDLYCANSDFYKVRLRENDGLYVAIAFDGNQADLDLMLYDPFGQVVSQSAGTGDSELCRLERAPAGGFYYIGVTPFDGKARYDLFIAMLLSGPGGFPAKTAARHWTLY